MSQDSFLSRALSFFWRSKEDNHHSKELHTSQAEEKTSSAESDGDCSADLNSNSHSTSNSDNEVLPASHTRTSESPASETDSELFTPAHVMRALGVEILEDGGDGYYLVGFQGGAFVFFFEEDRLNVMYNDIVECTFADSLKAAFVANDINGDYAVWSCYLRSSKRGRTDKPIKVCFSQMFALTGDFKRTTEFIHGVLTSAFSIGRDFRAKFHEALKDDSNLANTLNRKDFLNKLELAKRLIEVGNFDEVKEELPPASHLTIDALSGLFDDTDFGEPVSLRCMVGTNVEVIEDAQKVTHFDLRNYIRTYPNCAELDSLTLVVQFSKQDLIINLKKMPGSSSKSLFFMMNLMRSGADTDMFSRHHSTVSCRATVEIRLTTAQEDYWEVKYMIDEARDKHQKNDFSSLTDEQKMMLIQLTPNVQDDMYWGIKYFNQDCWYQSLFYFKRVFYNYSLPTNTSDHKEDMIADICLYLGITYYHLRMFDRSYYYLDRSRKYNSILASEWFVNCLCSMKDPLAVTYIKEMLHVVSSDLEETTSRLEDGVKNEFYDYYLFLKRKLVQAMVIDGRLDDAEKLLLKMIENNENVNYSKIELDAIHKLRSDELNVDPTENIDTNTNASDPSDGDNDTDFTNDNEINNTK